MTTLSLKIFSTAFSSVCRLTPVSQASVTEFKELKEVSYCICACVIDQYCQVCLFVYFVLFCFVFSFYEPRQSQRKLRVYYPVKEVGLFPHRNCWDGFFFFGLLGRFMHVSHTRADCLKSCRDL